MAGQRAAVTVTMFCEKRVTFANSQCMSVCLSRLPLHHLGSLTPTAPPHDTCMKMNADSSQAPEHEQCHMESNQLAMHPADVLAEAADLPAEQALGS